MAEQAEGRSDQRRERSQGQAEPRTDEARELTWYSLTEDQQEANEEEDQGCSYCGEEIEPEEQPSMRRLFAFDENTGLEKEARVHDRCFEDAEKTLAS